MNFLKLPVINIFLIILVLLSDINENVSITTWHVNQFYSDHILFLCDSIVCFGRTVSPITLCSKSLWFFTVYGSVRARFADPCTLCNNLDVVYEIWQVNRAIGVSYAESIHGNLGRSQSDLGAFQELSKLLGDGYGLWLGFLAGVSGQRRHRARILAPALGAV